jgi:O-6-methylguanine DNA methyltransferase
MKKTTAIADTLVVTRALASLPPEKAPALLAPAVLRRVGLDEKYWKLESPFGALFVAQGPAGISFVRRTASAARFEREFRLRHGRAVRPAAGPAPRALRDAVRGKPRKAGELRLDLRDVTEFERAVLRKALEIPAGEVRPYGWIAKEIGRPDAVRAAGGALAKNPVPLLIPCHRVVKSDGTVGDYIFGSRMKRALLESEGAQPRALEALAASGVRYLGNEEKRYFCLPTCGGFDSLRHSNRVPFGSAREALAAGFEPCGDCRPAIAS